MSRQGVLEDERGFTLGEVIATIIIMGIVFGIATSTWFKAAEIRRVDSATNQVVADLRLAHTQAKNRLTNSTFVVPADPVPAGVVDPLSTYEVGTPYQAGPPEVPEDIDTMILPGDDQGTPKTKISAATTITFHPDGGAEKDPPEGTPGDFTVMVTSTDGDPSHTIRINPITSRVKVVN